jgi:RNA polymerase sigma factor (sigma-70 family)
MRPNVKIVARGAVQAPRRYNLKREKCAEVLVISGSRLKQDWVPGADSFRRFLEWLDSGSSAPGERYLEMRRRLVDYFDRKRCAGADDLADETLNRVARRLEEEGVIEASAPAQYCYIVARFVFFEYLRRADRAAVPYDEASSGDTVPRVLQVVDDRDVESDEHARRFKCLEECLAKLPSSDRSLILAYYSGERGTRIERRRELAEHFGLTANALAIRTCRIRSKLEECTRACMGQ